MLYEITTHIKPVRESLSSMNVHPIYWDWCVSKTVTRGTVTSSENVVLQLERTIVIAKHADLGPLHNHLNERYYDSTLGLWNHHSISDLRFLGEPGVQLCKAGDSRDHLRTLTKKLLLELNFWTSNSSTVRLPLDLNGESDTTNQLVPNHPNWGHLIGLCHALQHQVLQAMRKEDMGAAVLGLCRQLLGTASAFG